MATFREQFQVLEGYARWCGIEGPSAGLRKAEKMTLIQVHSLSPL